VDKCSWVIEIDHSERVMFKERADRKDWVRLKGKEVRPDCVVFCTGKV
jgi:dimethylaniline monooxygenase (N-oxide forming)